MSAYAPESHPQSVPTISARILPGWMNHDYAIEILTRQCVPSWPNDVAERLWAEHRERVRILPERDYRCETIPLNAADEKHVQRFTALLSQLGGGGSDVAGVVKVDLSNLVAIQHVVITERSQDYAALSIGAEAWRAEFLPIELRPPQIGLRYSIGPPEHSHPLSSTILYDLPGAEFAFLPQGRGNFAITQLPRHVIACRQEPYLVLKNGYHRSLARIISSANTSRRPTALLAVERSITAKAIPQDLSWETEGLPAAMMSDYVSEGFFLDVEMRRKRYQVQVKARWMAIDDG